MSQEAVVDLHPEELQLSGEEEEEESQGMDNGRTDHDLGLKIRRTVTQVGGGWPLLFVQNHSHTTRCTFTLCFT